MDLQTMEQWLQSQGVSESDDVLALFQKQLKLTLVPRTTRDEVAIGHSKFGGYPDLASAADHPGEELTLLAQIRLQDIASYEAVDVLPKEGLLSFFYHVDEQPWGGPDERHLWRVIYTETSALERVRIGEALKERAIAFDEIFAPDEDRLSEQLDEDVYEAFEEWRGEQSLHAIGGIPFPVQNDVFEDFEAEHGDRFRDPFLLFQMDSTEELDVIFGDVGIIYFVIPTASLRSKRFEETELLLQCY